MQIVISQRARTYGTRDRAEKAAKDVQAQGAHFVVVPSECHPGRFTVVFFLPQDARWAACQIVNCGHTVVA